MKDKIKAYDLIIIYSESVANSARDKHYKEMLPFSSKGSYNIYNDSYQYFLSYCRKSGIKAAFASSKDIIGPGLVQSFWTYGKKWVKHSNKAESKILFDKFTPENKKQQNKLKILLSSNSIYLFNKKKLTNIFQNKFNTYNNFSNFAIPSVQILKISDKEIDVAKNKLDKITSKHLNFPDLNNGYLAKDETGASGQKIFRVNFKNKGIEKIKRKFKTESKDKKLLKYVLQPFINGDKGFAFKKYSGNIDLRVIFMNDRIIQTYIRIAKKGNYKCNEHQGGDLVYMPNSSIPKDVVKITKKIVLNLKQKLDLNHCLYALDFIKSNNGNLYFVEGNNNPGIDWNHKKKKNEIESKKLIKSIVNELKLIIQERSFN